MVPARTRTVTVTAGLALLLSGCVGSASGDDGDTLTVFAAASLTDVFDLIADDFAEAGPGPAVDLHLAGSSTLAHQIIEGAPAGVFASAGPEPMSLVVEAGRADGDPQVFARNGIVIAVPVDNPAGVTRLADLTADGVTVAACAQEVPCGAAAGRALDAAGVTLPRVTLELNVRAALAKLRLGEVDAALVYRTDLDGETEMEAAVDLSDTGSTAYSAVVLEEAPDPEAAGAFIDHLVTDEAATALAEAGFRVGDRYR